MAVNLATSTVDASARRVNRFPAAEFVDALRTVRRPIVLGHVTPDADCLGSAFGLARSMRSAGVDAKVGLPRDCVASKLTFMLNLAGEVPRVGDWSAAGDRDAIIIADTASRNRINLEPPPPIDGDLASFNIDHHITNDDFCRYNWVDPHATSTCEMVAVLLRTLNWRIGPEVASLLYSGLHGDTAGFSLPGTNAESLEIAAELVRAGADVAHVGEQLCRSQGRNVFELLRRVYDHTKVAADGRIAYSHLSYQDITESGCKADDIDDQVSIPRALKGVRLAMLFTEGEPGVVRINLRGEGDVSVLELAKRFGGGGHTQSAGVRIQGRPLEAVVSEVVAAADAYLR
jgi:phosphoesterase RecJ-like protein